MNFFLGPFTYSCQLEFTRKKKATYTSVKDPFKDDQLELHDHVELECYKARGKIIFCYSLCIVTPHCPHLCLINVFVILS